MSIQLNFITSECVKVKKTHKQTLIDELKLFWTSYRQADLLTKSSNGDRRLREIRQKPPEGFKLISRQRSLTNENDRKIPFLEFKLVSEG